MVITKDGYVPIAFCYKAVWDGATMGNVIMPGGSAGAGLDILSGADLSFNELRPIKLSPAAGPTTMPVQMKEHRGMIVMPEEYERLLQEDAMTGADSLEMRIDEHPESNIQYTTSNRWRPARLQLPGTSGSPGDPGHPARNLHPDMPHRNERRPDGRSVQITWADLQRPAGLSCGQQQLSAACDERCPGAGPAWRAFTGPDDPNPFGPESSVKANDVTAATMASGATGISRIRKCLPLSSAAEEADLNRVMHPAARTPPAAGKYPVSAQPELFLFQSL